MGLEIFIMQYIVSQIVVMNSIFFMAAKPIILCMQGVQDSFGYSFIA